MPCPNCGHTLNSLGCGEPGVYTYWCPRCGTVRTLTTNNGRPERESDSYPRLVQSVRELLAALTNPSAGDVLTALGLDGLYNNCREACGPVPVPESPR
jgi:hypothetical protein